MKFSIATLACLLFAAPLFPAHGEDTSKETELIAALKCGPTASDAELHAADAACAELKRIGTERSVPALSELLLNDNLSHSARYVLESMPSPTAGKALMEALPHVSGSNAVGIINSLAFRGETAAVPDLIKSLSNTDPLVASAAAEALGSLGGEDAAKSLEESAHSATGAVHAAAIDGLLGCANKLLMDHADDPALKIFQPLYDNAANSPGVRLAAFRGVILASGARSTELITGAIAGADADAQGAALQAAAKISGADLTEGLSKLLPTVQPAVQIAVIQCLAYRDDPSAASAIIPLADSENSDVRLAAITALGELGDGSAVLPLAKKAATGSKDEKAGARYSLLVLHRGDIAAQIFDLLDSAEPAVKLELIRSLGERDEKSAVQKLLKLSAGTDDSIRTASLQALAQLASPGQIPDLIQLVVSAASDDARSESSDALVSACQHIESQGLPLDVQALMTAMRSAPMEARLALLPVCSSLTEAPAREALRTAIKDSDPRVHEAAIRALSETRDGELLPDLLKLAGETGKEKVRVLGIRGSVQLVTQEDTKLSIATRLAALKTILAAPLALPEKRAVLSGLGSIADEGALAVALPMLDDATVKPEAAQAIIQIAGAISGKHPAKASAALKKVIAETADSDTKDSAEKALKKIKAKKQG